MGNLAHNGRMLTPAVLSVDLNALARNYHTLEALTGVPVHPVEGQGEPEGLHGQKRQCPAAAGSGLQAHQGRRLRGRINIVVPLPGHHKLVGRTR